MQKPILSLLIAMAAASGLYAQFDINKIEGQIKSDVSNVQNVKKPLSEDEIVHGLKDALTVGSNNSSGLASKVDGYYKNPNIKIPFPPEAQKMESTVREMGMNKQADDFVLTMNRAAEEAAKQSAPIFIDAVKNMNISDGVKILHGNNDAATVYMKDATSNDLRARFTPIVKQAIQKTEVTRYWQTLAEGYDRIPFVQKVNPNLDEYITQKALDGLFYLLAQEELKIRKDPAAQVTDILKRVFGN